MPQAIVILQCIGARPHRPFPIQGISGKKYGHANFEDAYGGHVIRLTAEQCAAWSKDIFQGAHRPMCGIYIRDVLVPDTSDYDAKCAELDTLRADLAAFTEDDDELKVLTFRELFKVAREEGVPYYAVCTTVRAIKAAIRKHRSQPHETNPSQLHSEDGNCDSPPLPAPVETAA